VKRIALALTGILALFLAGCAGLVSGGSPLPPQMQLSISPRNATVLGDNTEQFTAQAADGSSPAVTWSVNGVVGGTATTGLISTTGLYTAPEFPPVPNQITIGIADATTPSIKASVAVLLDNPIPQISAISPLQFPVGTFTLTINGAHFATNAVVLVWNDSAHHDPHFFDAAHRHWECNGSPRGERLRHRTKSRSRIIDLQPGDGFCSWRQPHRFPIRCGAVS
jgi:hypothetical protein